MKEFIYQIKLAAESSGFFRPTLSRGLIEAEVVTKVKEMHDIETSYIRKFNSIESGYNCVVSSSTVVEQEETISSDALDKENIL